MNRAMFAGVAGMKAHQTKMDVIGNNIANVNTYGYKTQRAVFSDVYYQTLSAASAATATRGGTNPSTVGYGSTLLGTQAQMTQSSMQNTGYGLDLAIQGEGFLQVMDADGNIFYTKAGMLDIDSNGYLVDINGNFVLGASTADGDPASQKIRVNNLGSIETSRASQTQKINGVNYTITSANANEAANVSINFSSSEDMPAGLKAQATISTTGAITVQLNAYEKFSSWEELNDAINEAITEANGGVQHKAGLFTITSSDPEMLSVNNPLTGAQIAGGNFGIDLGGVTGMDDGVFGTANMQVQKVSSDFAGSGEGQFSASFADGVWTIKLTIDGEEYTGTLSEDTLSSSILLKGANGDYVQVSNPGYDKFNNAYKNTTEGANFDPEAGTPATWTDGNVYGSGNKPNDPVFTPSTPSKDLGLGSYPWTLTGGTVGGVIGLNELSVAIASDGSVVVSHSAVGDVVVGSISLASFANPNGLQMTGSNYYTVSSNSGDPVLSKPGEDGTGALKTSALEMSNVDLSNEFAEMITTQRGFQANSRMITVSDEMLEELVNLKR